MPSLESYRPGPERLWIRYRPRRWPAAPGSWTDLARATLGHEGRSDALLPVDPPQALADVVYLAPVPEDLELRRLDLAREWAATGSPVLLQRSVGDTPPVDAEGVTEVWDLLPALESGNLASLERLPRGASTVWPLIAALSDRAELVTAGLDRLAATGVAVVQPLALELTAHTKRRLAENVGDDAFDRLFHGPPPAERELARRVAERGLRPFLPRPLPTGNPRLKLRRHCAGELRLAAHLAHRLGRPETQGQAYLRAARWIDREDHDLAALVEEGNLEIVDWIDEGSRTVVEDVVAGRRPGLVVALEKEFCGPEDAADAGR